MNSDSAIAVLERRKKWDIRFMRIAREISSWSKDPSTKCGAVIVDPDNNIIATGINGFPSGISDIQEFYEDRKIKLSRIIHCEMNAILRARRSLSGHTLYTWPLMSCDRCSPHVIQSGISRCVAPEPTPYILERWKDSMEASRALFREASVELTIYPIELITEGTRHV